MPKLPDLSNVRGMSEPFYFAFNVQDQKKKQLLCHAVIFTSFVMPDDNQSLKLAVPEDDPRFPHFIRYVWDNFLKYQKEQMEKSLAEAEKGISKLDTDIAATNQKLKDLKT